MTFNCMYCDKQIWDKHEGYSTFDKRKLKRFHTKGLCFWCGKPHNELALVAQSSLEELPMIMNELQTEAGKRLLEKRLLKV